jgi:pilus assembly protein Flp/PilA
MTLIRKLWQDENGADATEYALLAALVAVGIIGGAEMLGGSISALFTGIAGTVEANTP